MQLTCPVSSYTWHHMWAEYTLEKTVLVSKVAGFLILSVKKLEGH